MSAYALTWMATYLYADMRGFEADLSAVIRTRAYMCMVVYEHRRKSVLQHTCMPVDTYHCIGA
ncbi:protein of unknown function (plasmid) [Rhodovastum atsumiense]|nr:protein of unknown function [Rhodovastum atsumiense]